MTTRMTGPLVHTPKSHGARRWFGHLPLANDPDYVVFFDDFLGVAQDQTNDWTVVKDAGASVALAADTVGGELLMSSTATTNDDGASVQGNEVFVLTAGKRLWFETRVKLNDATQSELFAGLTVNFATNPEAVLAAADRVGFQKNDGDDSLLLKTEDGGAETSSDSGVDMADATYVRLGFLWDGISTVEFFINRKLVGTHTAGISEDENMAIGLYHLSGVDTGTKTSTWDYVFVAMER